MRMRHNASSADASNLIYWAVAQSGGWSDAADWTTHTVPGAGTTAVISARSRTGYTVSLGKPEAAAVLRINAAAATVDDSSTLTIGHLLTNPTRKYVTLFVSCSIPYFGRLEEGSHLGWLTL